MNLSAKKAKEISKQVGVKLKKEKLLALAMDAIHKAANEGKYYAYVFNLSESEHTLLKSVLENKPFKFTVSCYLKSSYMTISWVDG